MKISLEAPQDKTAIANELARVKKYNDGKPAELMLQVGQEKVGGPVNAALVGVDGISARIKALPLAQRKAIAKAIKAGSAGGTGWVLSWNPESRAEFPDQFKAKVDAIVTELEA